MHAPNPEPIVNLIIEKLPHEVRKRILNKCEKIDLIFGETLYELDHVIKYAYFPMTGFISLVTMLRDHQPLEVALIGNEGILGATLVLGVPSAPMQAIVQGSGTALRIPAEQLRQELQSHTILTDTFNRYLYVLLTQLAQTAACTHFHEIEPRLARWLLMLHDRAHSNILNLTQEFLANMLGVRRSSITVAAGILQDRKLIHYTRGKITILDRKGLEAASCECYAAITHNSEY